MIRGRSWRTSGLNLQVFQDVARTDDYRSILYHWFVAGNVVRLCSRAWYACTRCRYYIRGSVIRHDAWLFRYIMRLGSDRVLWWWDDDVDAAWKSSLFSIHRLYCTYQVVTSSIHQWSLETSGCRRDKGEIASYICVFIISTVVIGCHCWLESVFDSICCHVYRCHCSTSLNTS